VTTSSVAPSGDLAAAITLRGVGKRYRLFTKPFYRFLDLFGACPAGPRYFSEHIAVGDVNLTIDRGEKVAIIGRNGAGKSTLLKLITGLVQPTSGEVEVNGRVSNLLQIGSGFHPDFTGRQNVYANLAHQGIVGAAATKLFDEILAFAEVEEYIDQPMKTYSTGMCSRLMFASSVVIRPEILIVDEILGVGDAYFAHKSFERMRKLSSQEGATLLLVTHDVYSALNLCDRFIWLDRGVVKFDGDGKSAVALYDSSIKEQEEHALRQQNVARLASTTSGDIVNVLVRSTTGFALDAPLALEAITLGLSGGRSMALTLSEGAAGWSLLSEGNLSRTQTVLGRSCRTLATTGSVYHKAEWAVTLPSDAAVETITVRWCYEGSSSADLRVFTPDRTVVIRGALDRGAGWQERTFGRTVEGPRELDLVKQTDYGTGLVRITRVQFLDRDGAEVVKVPHGGPLTLRMHLWIDPALTNRRGTFIVAFVRHASPYSACVYQPDLYLGPSEDSVVTVSLDPLLLGSGRWYVNIAVGEPEMLTRESVQYFALEPGWYHLLAARIELEVASISKLDAAGVFVVLPATIAVSAPAATVPVPSR
jgi:ABC-type polysaccharide/polyol phosphate transport system ATPase subunit